MAVIGTAARRYAAALLDVARERGQEGRCLADLQAFQREMERHDDLREVLTSPTVSSDAAARVVSETAKRMRLGDLAVAFLALLASRRRLVQLPQIVEAFSVEQERRAGRERGELVTAAPLTEPQAIRVRAAVARAVGRHVVLQQRTDPALLGGLRVTVGDRVYDLSTGTYLETLRSHLTTNR